MGNGEEHDSVPFVGIYGQSLVLTVFYIDIHGQNKGKWNALKTKLSVEDCHTERPPRPVAIFAHSFHRFNLLLCHRTGQTVRASNGPPPDVCVFSRMYSSSYISQESRGAPWDRHNTLNSSCAHACSPWALQCLCLKRRARGAGGGGSNGDGAGMRREAEEGGSRQRAWGYSPSLGKQWSTCKMVSFLAF